MWETFLNNLDIKIIAFNEFFDTKVDNNIIAANTLNGIYINKYFKDSGILDDIIENEGRLHQNIIETDILLGTMEENLLDIS